jgi:hypothetical protein
MEEFHFDDRLRRKAMQEAERRQSQNELCGRAGRNGGPASGAIALHKHILGAAAELAVAVYLGMEEYVFQDCKPVRGSADLPGGIDVKCRPNHNWDLLIQLDDSLSKIFVLVTIQSKRTFIHGWIKGSEIKNEWIKEYRPGRPTYSIPQVYLHKMEELKCLVDAA